MNTQMMSALNTPSSVQMNTNSQQMDQTQMPYFGPPQGHYWTTQPQIMHDAVPTQYSHPSLEMHPSLVMQTQKEYEQGRNNYVNNNATYYLPPPQRPGYFDSILYQDQHEFMAELEREQQLDTHRHQPLTYSFPKHVESEIHDQTEIPQQSVEIERNTNQIAYASAVAHVHRGPKVGVGPHVFASNPPLQDYSCMVKLQKIMQEAPNSLGLRSSFVLRELASLGKLSSVLSIYYPVVQSPPGVYTLKFHIDIQSLFTSDFQVWITDDYPAEAPGVHFEQPVPGDLETMVTIRRIKNCILASVPFSFQVKAIVLAWIKVCVETFSWRFGKRRNLIKPNQQRSTIQLVAGVKRV